MSTTTIRVSALTRQQVAALARDHGVSQTAYLEQLVAERAAARWEEDFWSQMDGSYDEDDLAALAEQETAYETDFEVEA